MKKFYTDTHSLARNMYCHCRVQLLFFLFFFSLFKCRSLYEFHASPCVVYTFIRVILYTRVKSVMSMNRVNIR